MPPALALLTTHPLLTAAPQDPAENGVDSIPMREERGTKSIRRLLASLDVTMQPSL